MAKTLSRLYLLGQVVCSSVTVVSIAGFASAELFQEYEWMQLVSFWAMLAGVYFRLTWFNVPWLNAYFEAAGRRYNFCGNCGHSLLDYENNLIRKCPNCGKKSVTQTAQTPQCV